MLSAHDRWLLPPESKIPELEDEDRERLLLEILWNDFRKNAAAHCPEHSVKVWIRDTFFDHGDVFEEMAALHKEAIEEAWVEEHTNP